MPGKPEKTESPKSVGVVELEDTMLDIVTGGVSSGPGDGLDLLCDTTNKCNAVVPTCGAST